MNYWLRKTKAAGAASLIVLLAGCAGHNPQPSHHVEGKVVGDTYTSPHGHFSVPFPVSREVNGRVADDDAESVVFRDNWGSRMAFSSGLIYSGSPMMKELTVQGPSEALADYLTHRYGDMITVHFHSDVLGGTSSCIVIRPVVPKMGVAAFIHDNRIYLVETDLIPGVPVLIGGDVTPQGSHDQWLENRAIELLKSVEIR